jgi:translation initiation factor 6 (eIF-6)
MPLFGGYCHRTVKSDSGKMYLSDVRIKYTLFVNDAFNNIGKDILVNQNAQIVHAELPRKSLTLLLS